MGISHFGAPSDGAIFVGPEKAFGLVGTWTLARNAAGNYSLNLTAAANSPFLVIPLDRGIQLASFDLLFSIATAALTTHTAAVYRSSIVNGAVATVTNPFAAAPVGTAPTTNIAVVNLALAQPFEAGVVADSLDYLEIAIVNPGTAVYKFYGAVLYGARSI